MSEESSKAREFQRAVSDRRVGIASEFWGFLKHNKKWCLLPFVVVILLIGLLVIFFDDTATTDIYTLLWS
jgi:hypothetical protein